ncbi:MAG: 2-oxoacid:acceptor oxidoreductase subunit alpha [Thermoplasmatota archaeon]
MKRRSAGAGRAQGKSRSRPRGLNSPWGLNEPELRAQRADYISRVEGQTLFELGDVAVAWGALFAGCNFFASYPITPASEIGELLARELPRAGGRFIQMEDEIASLSAVIGAAWVGARAMTATSGPGFSLMQEGLGYAFMTETPCVVVDVQRSGPSTGQATKPAQGDVMQARWGTHGDHETIALCPNSAQECFDLTYRAFEVAQALRTPVLLLLDGEVGHMREAFSLRRPEPLRGLPPAPPPSEALPFGGDPVPPPARFGEGASLHVTGSTHRPDGMRDIVSPEVHDALVRRLCRKIEASRAALRDLERDVPDDSRVVIFSYGAPSRPAHGALLEARRRGLRVGYIRPRTLWPFPREDLRGLPGGVRRLLVPEMNLGQMAAELERWTDAEVVPLTRIGGVTHTAQEILSKLEEVY